MFLSKRLRWTLYILLIVGVIVGGWYLTLTESPDQYTPREVIHDLPSQDTADGEDTDALDGAEQTDEPPTGSPDPDSSSDAATD